MSNEEAAKASCLCGHITLSTKKISRAFTACHCNMCRKWGGTWMAVDCGTDVRFEGEGKLRIFDSSAWAERGFCSQCGTHLFYKVKRENLYYVPIGLFEDINDFVFERQIYIDKKPEYYCFSNSTVDVAEKDLSVADPPES